MDTDQIGRSSVADVYKGERLAATLTRTSRAVTFQYLEDYAQKGLPPVAHSLPVLGGGERVVTENGALPAFFAGLLPEGFRFSQLAHELKVSTSDEFRLLLAVGANVPGDVRILPHGVDPQMDLGLDAEVDIDSGLDFSEYIGKLDPVSLPGFQGKISARRARRAITARGRAVATDRSSAPAQASSDQYILKYDAPGLPLLSRNELAHLDAARIMGIPVEVAELCTDVHGREGLLARRFDRVVLPGQLHITRLAMEDAGQLLNIPPAAKYDPSTEEVSEALVGACAAKPVARRNIFMQSAFAYFTGNGDLHAKNYSVLQGLDGVWTMAPIYDIPSTYVYGDKEMALSICGRKRDLRLAHWLEFADAIGLPRKAAVTALRKVLRAAERVDLGQVGYSGSTLRGAQRALEHRRDGVERDLSAL